MIILDEGGRKAAPGKSFLVKPLNEETTPVPVDGKFNQEQAVEFKCRYLHNCDSVPGRAILPSYAHSRNRTGSSDFLFGNHVG